MALGAPKPLSPCTELRAHNTPLETFGERVGQSETDGRGRVERAEQRIKAERFRELHRRPSALILVNVWDVASARMIEEAGFPAAATTSAGIAAVLGYPDGEHISRREMLEMVRRIARAVRLPLSADLEAGYGTALKELAETARELLATGAIGMNLEDSTHDPHRPLTEISLQVEKLRAIREVADAAGVPLVINARTDVYLAATGEQRRSLLKRFGGPMPIARPARIACSFPACAMRQRLRRSPARFTGRSTSSPAPERPRPRNWSGSV